jgi:Zinc dependent phospholipase C
MPGWYIHINVARKAIDRLAQNPTAASIFAANGMDATTLTKIAHDNPTYVALGAIGPDIFFLLPDFKPPVGNMLWKLASEIRDLFTWWDDNFLGPYESAMGPIGDNLQDELNALSGGLKDEIEDIFGQAFAFLKDAILKLILQQYDFFGLLSSGAPAGFDEQTFFWSDMLHYRQTYEFGAVLWQRAAQETDPELKGRFQAFALGWMSHLATDVTGHAFVNQKAGGPYRLHWQRHHLVENHMDALVYNTDHGAQPIYQEMSNAALHLWLAFNPDGTSRVNFFDPEPNPPYPDGDHSADIVGRHAVWDVDSDMPDELAQFIADGLKAVYWPNTTPPPAPFEPQNPMAPLNASNNGPVACCPTIISTLTSRVPYETGGFATKDDIIGAYWWLYKYVKWTTTDYYKIRRPEPPDVFVIPSFPSPPGSGDSDPGPGAGDDNSVWQDALSFLLALFAWAAWLAEVAVWPAAVIAGIIGGTVSYPLRLALYEYLELPLYNLWLGVHTYLAMTGYVMPMPGEINSGLNTLGVSVSDGWATTVVALGTPDGGLTPSTVSVDSSGMPRTGFPKDVVMDPPGFITGIFGPLLGVPHPNGEFPSEFNRPWRWPDKDNQGNTINVEQMQSVAGPYIAGMNANALFGAAPGNMDARHQFEKAKNEGETLHAAAQLVPAGLHLGDPQDYTAYLIATLTRDNLDPSKVFNFNLDADRGYGYLCWDWLRFKSNSSTSIPAGFKSQPSGSMQHAYRTPKQPGYGWSIDEVAGGTPGQDFHPNDPAAGVIIRYIGKEGKFG